MLERFKLSDNLRVGWNRGCNVTYKEARTQGALSPIVGYLKYANGWLHVLFPASYYIPT